jgi:hypothetical protein
MAQRGGTLVHRSSAQEILYIYEVFYESMKEHGRASARSFRVYSGMYSGYGYQEKDVFHPSQQSGAGARKRKYRYIYVDMYRPRSYLS